MIQTHDNSFIQSPILIGNIKARFSLALLYQKEKSPGLSNAWQRKKYVMLPWQRKKYVMLP